MRNKYGKDYMIPATLKEQIKKLRNEGKDDETVKQELVQLGWSKNILDQAFVLLNRPLSQPQAPTPPPVNQNKQINKAPYNMIPASHSIQQNVQPQIIMQSGPQPLGKPGITHTPH